MPESLYIHIPFCNSICTYCDFAKVYYDLFSRKRYLSVLIEEIKSLSIEDRSLKTIYIGGGTPSSLDDEELKMLLSYLHERFDNVEEFSFECNPESLTREKMIILKKYGVNRISLGVQTTSKRGLKILGRKHKVKDVKRCLKDLKEVGFDNINLDFIFGYRNESYLNLLNDIHFAINAEVSHLSFYSLIIEDNTILKINNEKYLSDDRLSKMYSLINRKLKKASFNHYEISNYAKKGKESKHNLKYWKDETYYAVGVSSSCYVADYREKNTSSITSYLNGVITKEIDKLTSEDKKEEFIMLSFRLKEGVDLKRYSELFSTSFLEEKKKAIEKNREFLNISFNNISIKEEYMFISDSIVSDFF